MTIQDIDNNIATLKKEYKNEIAISKFLIMRADSQLKKMKQDTSEHDDDEKFKRDVLNVNKILKDGLKNSIELRKKIHFALALLEKNKMIIEASTKRESIEQLSRQLFKKLSGDQKSRLKKIKSFIREKDISISCTVYELIRKAMSAYYFEKIGDSLLERTKNPKNFNLSNFKILIDSYNTHVYIPVEVEQVLNK